MSEANQTTTSIDSFLEEHHEPMQSIAGLREWCKGHSHSGEAEFKEFGKRLKKFRDQLNHHFSEEESDGYLAPVLEVAPRFTDEVAVLQQQHREFLDRLDALAYRVNETGASNEAWDDVCAEFESVLHDLRKHEGAENSIMQSAFDDDVGTCD